MISVDSMACKRYVVIDQESLDRSIIFILVDNCFRDIIINTYMPEKELSGEFKAISGC